MNIVRTTLVVISIVFCLHLLAKSAEAATPMKWTCSGWNTCYKIPAVTCKRVCYNRNPKEVLRVVFGERDLYLAKKIVWCESKYYIWAGTPRTHFGLYQLNPHNIRVYSNGKYKNFWDQAWAAKRMKNKEGWKGPWAQCYPN